MKNDLASLIAFVGSKVVFDETNYPELKGADDAAKLRFAIQHSAFHFAKTAGKIAAVAENMDHGGKPDVEELKTNIWKSFVNACWIAEKAGMSGGEILEAIERKYREE